MKVFAKDLGFPEAPVLLPDASLLCVEMSEDKGCVTHISPDGTARRILARTGRPNGLALDKSGDIWVAETAMRAVLRMTLDGRHEIVARGCAGNPFLFLNDLAFAPNGDLYVTDSGILMEDVAPGGQLAPNYRTLPYDGRVYRMEPATGIMELVDRGLTFANGIAFGPDGSLFVAETLSGNIYRYASRNGRITGRRELFGNVIEHFNPAQLKGPDGMKFASDGTLHVAVFGQGDITVLDQSGRVTRRSNVEGMFPTNLAFAPRGGKHMYVTEAASGTVQILEAGIEGLPLYG